MKYEKKARKGCSARWMEVPESYVRKVFKCNFIDVETYFRSMAEGLSVFTPFYEYRQKKVIEGAWCSCGGSRIAGGKGFGSFLIFNRGASGRVFESESGGLNASC